MPGPGRFFALCALLAASGVSTAAPSPPAAPAPEPGTSQYVRELGSPVFVQRDRATVALWRMGERARPALAEAARSDDPEVAQRAQEILDRFDWGVYPDTSPEVHEQIRAFRTGDPTAQQTAISTLIRLGDTGVSVLPRLLARGPTGEYRHALFEHLCWVLRSEVPRHILAGRLEHAEALLALNASGPFDQGLTDYAVFLHLRGRTAAAASELEAIREYGGPAAEAAAQALVFIYRAGGQQDKARALAAVVEKFNPAFQDTYESLLEDLAVWDVLAGRAANARANSRDGLMAFRLRLAGRTTEAGEIIDRQLADTLTDTGHTSGVDAATLALMLNDRPLDGISRLRASRNAPHILADVLSVRLEFGEALELVGGGPGVDESAPNLSYLNQLYGTRRGRLLWQLGQRETAAKVFDKAAGQIGSDGTALTHLIRAEVRSGRHDLACEHLGRALAAAEHDGGRIGSATRQDGFEVLFGAEAESAAHWWRVLRRSRPQGELPGATMRKVRSLLIGAAPAIELTSALRSIETVATDYADAPTRALARAAVLRSAGRTAEAVAVLSRAADTMSTRTGADRDDDDQARRYGRGTRGWVYGTDERFRFWMELGDLLVELGRHREAATRLDQGWQRFPDNPVLLYLSGQALLKAGDEQEGRRRVELAHWVPLGNARLRGRFLEELADRGLLADARRERDLAREAGWVSELYLGNVWNQVARASVLLKDYTTAADANRRAIHYLLKTPGVTYVEGHAYVTVPQTVRAYTARSLLTAGKVEEAIALAKGCLAVMPGDSDLAIGMVPELDRLGRSKEADELFRQVWNAYESILREYPDSGWARYSAAWLAAGCRRELSTALEHAAKAVEMEPGMNNYREALAEVHFRRGDRDRAVTIMKELAHSDRRSYHYKRQLERYQTGDPASPVLDAGE